MNSVMTRRRMTRWTTGSIVALSLVGGVVAADEPDGTIEIEFIAPAGEGDATVEETDEVAPEWKRMKRESRMGFHELHVAIMEAFLLAKQGWIAECAEGGDPSSEDCKALHTQIKQDKKDAKVDLREMRAKARADWKAAKDAHKVAKFAEVDPAKAAERAERVEAREQRKAERDAAKAERRAAREAAKAERKAGG